MKKLMIILTVTVVSGMLFAFPVFGETDHSGPMGEMIRETKIDGYGFMYHLVDMVGNMKGMEDMQQMKATHHLMVFIKAPHGHAVENAKVGYMVTGPDGEKQKAMAMGMSGGFGADVNLKQKGTYTISTKVVEGNKKLVDKFSYEIK